MKELETRLMEMELDNLIVLAGKTPSLQIPQVLDSCKQLYIGYKTRLRHTVPQTEWPLSYHHISVGLYDLRKTMGDLK